MSTNNSKCLVRTGPSQIAMIRSTSFYTISETQGLNRMDMSNTFLNLFSMEMLAQEGELSLYINLLLWLLLT